MGRDTKKKKKKKQDNDAETCLVEDEKVQTALCELTSKQTSELHWQVSAVTAGFHALNLELLCRINQWAL